MTPPTNPSVDDTFLTGKEIAISISDSPDLTALGYGADHLVAAMVEFARHVFLHGGSVAYGGDLRAGGFTQQLLQLAERAPARREGLIHCYLAWPLHLALVQARVDDLALAVQFERLPEATGAVDPPTSPKDPRGALLFAQNLTAMRHRMARDAAARVLMGGPVAGSLGAMPGLVEEALVTLGAGKPTFLVGAFGGCASLLWRALTGQPTPELDVDHQDAIRPGYRQVVAGYNAWAPGAGYPVVDYPRIRERLATLGPAGLGNGLSIAENTRLIETPYVPEMLALVLLGCQRVFGGKAGG